jgi:pimeloyl-ACP methyl ester carboxylesterase
VLRRSVPALLVALASACGGARAPTRESAARPARAAGAGRVLLPEDYDDSRRYPVVVLLPASNGSAEALLRYYPAPPDVIVLVAAGVGTPADYASGASWSRTIERYERQLRADLAALRSARRVDTTRVVLAGFSMGGDLAWALALRNPRLVGGAVVMASRASYRGRPEDLRALARRGARFYFTMGEEEDRAREAGAKAAGRLLDGEGMAYVYRRIEGGHVRAPADVFAEAVEYVLHRR